MSYIADTAPDSTAGTSQPDGDSFSRGLRDKNPADRESGALGPYLSQIPFTTVAHSHTTTTDTAPGSTAGTSQPDGKSFSRGLRDNNPADRESGALGPYLSQIPYTTVARPHTTVEESQQPASQATLATLATPRPTPTVPPEHRKNRFSLSDLSCCCAWPFQSRQTKDEGRDPYQIFGDSRMMLPPLPIAAASNDRPSTDAAANTTSGTRDRPTQPKDVTRPQDTENRNADTAVYDIADEERGETAPPRLKRVKSSSAASNKSTNSTQSPKYNIFPDTTAAVPPLPSGFKRT